MAEALLQVRNLSTHFQLPDGSIHTAVDRISFDLDVGDSLGVVGESGSGKSMLVRSIMNLLPATAIVRGTVTYRGQDIGALPMGQRRRLWGPEIAMVFQDPMTSLNPVRRIGVQITDPLRHHLGMSRRAASARAVELLDLVRIPDPARRLDQYPHELSGGMRQRIVIAIALACEPALLIADEPTTALDVTVQQQILELLGDLQQRLDMAMILISHDLGVVAGRTDRTAVMYGGRLAEIGDTAELFADPRHRYTEALLGSIPRLANPPHTRLDAIPGRPPNLADLPPGCRFAPRCAHADDLCREVQPELLTPAGSAVAHACHHPAPSRRMTVADRGSGSTDPSGEPTAPAAPGNPGTAGPADAPAAPGASTAPAAPAAGTDPERTN